MALSAEQLAQVRALRSKIDEHDDTTYSDDDLWAYIQQAEGDLRAAAAEIWEQKAAAFSSLVDTSESGSSRSASQHQKNALAMAALYSKKDEQAIADETPRPRSRRAVRL